MPILAPDLLPIAAPGNPGGASLAAAYLATCACVGGLAYLVLRRAPRSALHRTFALACLSLVAWLATLLAFASAADPRTLTWLGRANFAAAAVCVWLASRFVAELVSDPRDAGPTRRRAARAVERGWVAALALLTLLTPLVDRSETVRAGLHVTEPGPLFPLFAAHVAGYAATSVVQALLARRTAGPRLRAQLGVVGLGLAATASVSIFAGMVLPYAFGDFRYQLVGPLSAAFVVGAVAYSVLVQHLLEVRVVVRRTAVLAVLLALAEWAYSELAARLRESLPAAQDPLVGLAVSAAVAVAVAATLPRLRRWLEPHLRRLMGLRPRRHRRTRGVRPR